MTRHKPIDPDHEKLSEEQLLFYSTLGILSVTFASMEFKIKKLLSILINPDDSLIGTTMVERLSLEQGLNKLVEINLIRGFHEEKINSIISQIRKIKRNRNLFIHGVWGMPHPDEHGTVKVICDDRKIQFNKELHKVDPGHKQWCFNSIQDFKLPDLKKMIIEINIIITDIEDIISVFIDNPQCLYGL